MADIQTVRAHNKNEIYLRSQLERIAEDLRKKYQIRSNFGENEVRISGSIVNNGTVSWTPDTLSIDLNLGLAGKLFKSQIKKEIERTVDQIVA